MGGTTTRAPAAPGRAPAVLELAALSWAIGSVTIVDRIDLTVAEGEFLALIGPNGAGKTSLFNLVSGVTRPTGGSLALDGRRVDRLPPHRRARLGIGRTFQSSSVFATMTVAEHVELAARAVGARRVTAADRAGVLDRVRLGHRAGQPAGGLSHGDKRKLELAMLLASTVSGDGPRLMLLDEPMAGVAAEEVGELTEVTREIINGLYAEVIRDGVDRGVLDVDDVDDAAAQMRALIDGTFLTWLQDDWEATHTAYRDRCEAALMRLLGVR